jgi:hypothetical protein
MKNSRKRVRACLPAPAIIAGEATSVPPASVSNDDRITHAGTLLQVGKYYSIDPVTINGAMVTGTPHIDGPSYPGKVRAIPARLITIWPGRIPCITRRQFSFFTLDRFSIADG